MTDTLIITDEHGRAGRVTRQELMDRCARLRASKLLQWHLIGDSSPLLSQIQGHQPAHEQDDDLPIKDWSLKRLLGDWEENRDDFVEMLANGQLIGSPGGEAVSGTAEISHTRNGHTYYERQISNGMIEISRRQSSATAEPGRAT